MIVVVGATLAGLAAPAIVRAEPGELVLWLYGRGAAAEVEFDGPADSIAALQRLSLSV